MTWLLIDGNNLFCRDFYANQQYAVGSFLRRIDDLREQLEPTRVAICWDSGGSFRDELFSGYKAARGPAPDGLATALRQVREAVESRGGIESAACERFEADDLVATLAALAIDEGEQATIVSSDKDLHQCLADGRVNQILKINRPSRSRLAFDVMTAAGLVERYSVFPHQWIDYRALTGDASDGIPGCDGIGPKAAASILGRYDSLDDYYANPWKIKLGPSQERNLKRFRERLPLSRQLLKLQTVTPVAASWFERGAIGRAVMEAPR